MIKRNKGPMQELSPKCCIVLGAGDRCRREKLPMRRQSDVVIAADGGYDWAMQENYAVDAVIGDRDSSQNVWKPENSTIVPVEKDETDMALAVAEGRRLGCSRFLLYGGTGGRADHTFANYQLLASLAKRGEQGFLIDDRMTALAICNQTVSIKGTCGSTISIFSLSEEAEGVTIEGLYYQASGITLTNTFALGVSNHFTEQAAEITVCKGILLILGEYEPDDVCILSKQ